MPGLSTYLTLFAAILLEVGATAALQASQQFTKPIPTLIMTVCYLLAFFALSHALKVIPVGVSYAIWSGIGIVLVSLIGYVFFGQKLDAAALLGLGFIITGVIIVNVFSSSVHH